MPGASTSGGRALDRSAPRPLPAAHWRRPAAWRILALILCLCGTAHGLSPPQRRHGTGPHEAYLIRPSCTNHAPQRSGASAIHRGNATHPPPGKRDDYRSPMVTPLGVAAHAAQAEHGRTGLANGHRHNMGTVATTGTPNAAKTTGPPTAALGMTEDELIEVSSSLDNFFDRCVKACENSDISSAVSAIRDYVKAYEVYFSPFFELPVEAPVPPPGEPTQEPTPPDTSDAPVPRKQSRRNGADKDTEPSPDDALSYCFTAEEAGIDDGGGNRRWHVAIKPNVSRFVRRLIANHRKRCVGIMGRAMHQVSTLDELKAVTSVSREASRLGMAVLKGMYDAMSVIHAKLGRADRALEYLERLWSVDKRRRHRSYEPLLNYFEEHLDGDGMLKVLRHMTEVGRLPVSGLIFTRVVVTIALSARSSLQPLGVGLPDPSGDHPPSGSNDHLSQLYDKLRRQLRDALDVFHTHTCNRISLSARLGYVIFTVLSGIHPDLAKFTHVSPSDLADFAPASAIPPSPPALPGAHPPDRRPTSYGICHSCGHHLPLIDLSVRDRLSVFRNWLQHIYDYNFPEIARLANFYAWLHEPLRRGEGYTCVLDGQNIGYHKRQPMSPLDLRKVDAVVREMVRRGERPLIVLPYYARANSPAAESSDALEPQTLDLLFPGHGLPPRPIELSGAAPRRSKRYNRDEIALVDRWCELRQVYFCKTGSYDDNYFFLANVMTGCAEELAVLARFLRASLELSGTTDKAQTGSSLAAKLPSPAASHYPPAGGLPPHRPLMITVTNDTLTNLEIPGVDDHLMRALRDIPLTPYFFTFDEGWRSADSGGYGYNVVVGERLRYSLEMSAHGLGRYHIPLGFERRVLDFGARHTVWVSRQERPRVEPPPAGGFLDPFASSAGQSEFGADQELKQVNAWLAKCGYDELLRALEAGLPERDQRRRHSRAWAISTKTPEIIRQKFNPSQQTRWLCVDLSALDRPGAT
ncbi:pentatricopeptide repeat containing protein, putative [Babesia caballi]|uniref:Pentatricopeptide repeat containing protein, putative n=1 Tax=Babesia caballi TaxID=5871 RepID=A0AAV4LRN9_BABCB|nr:pentatricopeptide repeat containing protein, putative [Babesia caballi]